MSSLIQSEIQHSYLDTTYIDISKLMPTSWTQHSNNSNVCKNNVLVVSSSIASVRTRNVRQANEPANNSVIIPANAHSNEGMISDTIKKAKDKVKDKIQTKAKEKVQIYVEKETSKR